MARDLKRLVAKLKAELPEPSISETEMQAHFRASFAAVRAVIATHGPSAVKSADHPAFVALAALPHYRDTSPKMVMWFAGYFMRVLGDGTGGARVIASLSGEPEPEPVE